MNKTRVFYPVLWAFFAGGVLLGTLAANLASREALQTLGIHRIYFEQKLVQFSVISREWIWYVIFKRLKFWLIYVLLGFTAARWVVMAGGSALFGCVGAVFLVTVTRSWGFLAIVIFWGAVLPHYVAYTAACLFVMEALRVWKLTNRSAAAGKIAAGSLCWGVGIVCEIFLNPTLLRLLLKMVGSL